jgi:predicted dehydrogenase
MKATPVPQQALPIRVLLCGLGWWGLNWLKNIQSNRDYQLVGVVEKNPDTLRTAREQKNLDAGMCFLDIGEAIRAVRPDTAVVVVSPDKHGEIIRVALENNVHILSEKPLAKDLAEAKEFLRLHKKHPGLQFIVNQNYRGRDAIALLRDAIAAGKIGEVGFFLFSHQQTVKIPGYRMEMPSPVLEDMSIHHFDLMRYLTGQDFEEIYAREETVKWSWFKGKPVFLATIRMTNGVSGMYCGSWASEGKIGSWNGNIQVFGSNGCLELDDEGRVLFYEKHEVDESLLGRHVAGNLLEARKLQHSELQYTLEAFKNSLLGKARCETSIEDNARSFAGVIASRQSVVRRKPVRIDSLGLQTG